MHFDKFDICDAYNMYATLYNGSRETARIFAALNRLKYRPSHSHEYVSGLEENAKEILVQLVTRLEGEEAGEDMRRECFPMAEDVTLVLENSDDDPTSITAHAYYDHAKEWCDAMGSVQGSTWETEDGFLYDIWTWHPNLIAELKAEGFKLDLSNYSDCDESDIAIASHACECNACDYDFRKAERHMGQANG